MNASVIIALSETITLLNQELLQAHEELGSAKTRISELEHQLEHVLKGEVDSSTPQQ